MELITKTEIYTGVRHYLVRLSNSHIRQAKCAIATLATIDARQSCGITKKRAVRTNRVKFVVENDKWVKDEAFAKSQAEMKEGAYAT